jgi:tryptophanyl-tRNA synthetase
MMARSLSLTVPSGHLTLGNLLGAIQHWVTDQRGNDSLYGVADLHALTTEHDPASVRAITREQLGLLVAAGLDEQQCILFVQSQVPGHAQLHWLLEATAYDGELRRMIQYKEKSAQQQSVRSALLAYPVLMAADILLYGVRDVPVGEDQRQHLELARDLAIRFNQRYGDTFVVPRAVTPPVGARVMDLQDPAKKMSKSAAPDAPGTVRLLDPPDAIRRKVSRAVTDSGREVVFNPGEKPGVANLLTILAACSGTTPEVAAAKLDTYRDLKEAVAEAIIAVLAPLQERYAEVSTDPGAIEAMARNGAARAQQLAAPILARAQEAMGLLASLYGGSDVAGTVITGGAQIDSMTTPPPSTASDTMMPSTEPTPVLSPSPNSSRPSRMLARGSTMSRVAWEAASGPTAYAPWSSTVPKIPVAAMA